MLGLTRQGDIYESEAEEPCIEKYPIFKRRMFQYGFFLTAGTVWIGAIWAILALIRRI